MNLKWLKKLNVNLCYRQQKSEFIIRQSKKTVFATEPKKSFCVNMGMEVLKNEKINHIPSYPIINQCPVTVKSHRAYFMRSIITQFILNVY